jgi:hypothetical protein
VKDAQGRIKLNQLVNTTAVGAVSGTFWGTLIGLIFLMPLAGAAIGAFPIRVWVLRAISSARRGSDSFAPESTMSSEAGRQAWIKRRRN